MKDRLHDDVMAQVFREDPDYAVEILNAILGQGDQDELLIALRQMIKAFSPPTTSAEVAELNEAHIHRVLSASASLEIRGLSEILKAMNPRLVVHPIEHAKSA